MIYKPKSTKFNSSKYCDESQTIQHQSFVYTQETVKTVLFQAIQFSLSHLFAHSLKVKQFYLNQRSDPIRWNHSRPEWTLEHLQLKSTPHFLKLQHKWSLTIGLFNVISRTLVGGSLTLCWVAVSVLYSPTRPGCPRDLIICPSSFTNHAMRAINYCEISSKQKRNNG